MNRRGRLRCRFGAFPRGIQRVEFLGGQFAESAGTEVTKEERAYANTPQQQGPIVLVCLIVGLLIGLAMGFSRRD